MKLFKLLLKICLVLLVLYAGGRYYVWKNHYIPTHVVGVSMEPTIMDGDNVKAIEHVKPQVGDIVSIECKKCIREEDGNKWSGPIKRIIKIDENDCWWVEGDNKEHSWDSRNYGWVCPFDRKLEGVVKLD